MRLVRCSEEVYTRLREYADGRPLGKAIGRLLDAVGKPTFPAYKEPVSPIEQAPKRKLRAEPAVEVRPPKPTPNGRGAICCCPAAMVRKGTHLRWCQEGK